MRFYGFSKIFGMSDSKSDHKENCVFPIVFFGNPKILQKPTGCGRLQIFAKSEGYALKYIVFPPTNCLHRVQRYPTPLRQHP